MLRVGCSVRENGLGLASVTVITRPRRKSFEDGMWNAVGEIETYKLCRVCGLIVDNVVCSKLCGIAKFEGEIETYKLCRVGLIVDNVVCRSCVA